MSNMLDGLDVDNMSTADMIGLLGALVMPPEEALAAVLSVAMWVASTPEVYEQFKTWVGEISREAEQPYEGEIPPIESIQIAVSVVNMMTKR